MRSKTERNTKRFDSETKLSVSVVALTTNPLLAPELSTWVELYLYLPSVTVDM
jgi:hypothetical protein